MVAIMHNIPPLIFPKQLMWSFVSIVEYQSSASGELRYRWYGMAGAVGDKLIAQIVSGSKKKVPLDTRIIQTGWQGRLGYGCLGWTRCIDGCCPGRSRGERSRSRQFTHTRQNL